MATNQHHILGKAAQFGQFLGDFRLGNEGAFAAPYFDQAASDEILDCLAHRRAADAEPLRQAVLRRQLRATGKFARGNFGSQYGLDPSVSRKFF